MNETISRRNESFSVRRKVEKANESITKFQVSALRKFSINAKGVPQSFPVLHLRFFSLHQERVSRAFPTFETVRKEQ